MFVSPAQLSYSQNSTAGNTEPQPAPPLIARAMDANIQSSRTRQFAIDLLHELRGQESGKADSEPHLSLIEPLLSQAAVNSEITLRILEEIRAFLLG